MYSAKQRKLTAEEYVKIQMANPEEIAQCAAIGPTSAS